MQQIYIPKERLAKLKKNGYMLDQLKSKCACNIIVGNGNYLDIIGDPYEEYRVREVLFAFGRGFKEREALKLLNDKYYLSAIDLGQIFESKDRLHDIEARVIGHEGRTKKYIEEVSSALISVYNDTICIIGDIEAINEAEAAIKTLINGGSHRKAYQRLEALHRKNKNI
ncbi:MAG: KH domain-containing protein [Candidatus Micrarchaeaceae archaeon]